MRRVAGAQAYSRLSGTEESHDEAATELDTATKQAGVRRHPSIAAAEWESASQEKRAPSRSAVRDVRLAGRVFFWHGLFRGRRWLWPLLLLACSVGYEVAASFVMTVIGDFYLSISGRDPILFLHVLWRSLLVTGVVATLKAARNFAEEMCAARWRHQLTSFLHLHYISRMAPYQLAAAIGPQKADNADQRVASDAKTLTAQSAEVARKVLVIPGLCVYYTWYLAGLFGWTAPTACYLYFLLAGAATRALLRRVVPLVYLQERAEGAFRYDHAWLRACAEPVAFGGSAATAFERQRLGRSLAVAVVAQRAVALGHLPLYICTQFSEYLGSIVNYAAVGGAILWLSKAEGASGAEISSLIARGSFSCLYLIDAFSQGLEAASAAANAAGSANRVVELLERCGVAAEDLAQLSPFDDLDGGKSSATPPSDGQALPLRNTFATTDLSGLPRPYSPPVTAKSPGSELVANGSDAAGAAFAVAGLPVASAPPPPPLSSVQPLLRLDRLSVIAPGGNGALLVSELSIEVTQGVNLLICGPSGSGKTSLLRVIAGLWEPACGSMWLSGQSGNGGANGVPGVMFLAQRPYCFRGTLFEQLAYPYDPSGSSACDRPGCRLCGQGVSSKCLSERMWQALSTLKLTHLARRGFSESGWGAAVVASTDYAVNDEAPLPAGCSGTPCGGAGEGAPLAAATLALGVPAPVSAPPTALNGDINAAAAAAAATASASGCKPAQGLNTAADWPTQLSPGELQRLGLARILLRRPRLAFLDESTSALDEAAEAEALAALAAAGTTFVSVGHRASLRRWHGRALRLLGAEGAWSVEEEIGGASLG